MASNTLDVYALDKDFNLISMAIPYDNMQWNRRYYEAGDFAMQIPIEVFDRSWAYIGTKDRPELGMVQRIETMDDDLILVSGFFCEKMLDDRVCYPRYFGDASSTEQAARIIFEKYKAGLPITLAEPNNPMLGDRTQSDFSDDQLGAKLYSILESRECTYNIVYDFEANALLMKVWKGADRTQSQSSNAFQTFSIEYGNIISRSYVSDDSDYKNYAIIPANEDDDPAFSYVTYILDWTNGGPRKEIVFDMRDVHPEDGQSSSDFAKSVLQEAAERLLEYAKVEDINVDVVESGYLTDFDIGDKCDVVLSDIGIEVETRIVEVNEVFKPEDGHTLTVGLGNKRISNIRRAVNNI